MSNFRTKVLGLAAFATAFAGLSYGQTLNCNGGYATSTTNPTLRAEGETELVADVVATCATVGGQPPAGNVYASLSLPITSKLETTAEGGGPLAGNSDAVLQLTTGGVTTYYPGTVTGPTVSFSGVVFPATAAFTLTVSNIRVNAAGATNPQVTENLIVQYSNSGVTDNVTNPLPIQVGYILPSLSASLALSGVTNLPIINSFTTCAGNPIPGFGTIAPTANFTVVLKEVTGNAFRLQAGVGSEQGSFVANNVANLAATTGTATQATQIQLAFANVPTGATVYVPVSVTSGGTTLSLQGSLTPVSSPSGLVGLNGGVFGFTATAGALNVVYAVTADTSTGTNFNIPVYVIAAPNSAPVQTTAMSVLASYVPAAVVTGPTALIPTFAVSTTTPTNTVVVNSCLTTLLFPYVTNASGFETGIAVTNASTDNLKLLPAPGSLSTPVNGTCTLNFYGNATQPTQTVTPTLGAYAAATPTVVPVYANTLTAMIGSGGFTGYAIASCNFTEAHGFAFITDASGSFSGAMGYLAVVIPNLRGEGVGTGQ